MTEPVWWWRRENVRLGRACLFLDRDGVVVEETNYLCRPEDVRVLGGVARLIKAARARGWLVGLVTNQAGIGRGYYDWSDFEEVQREVARQLDLGAEPFDFIAACGAHAEASRPELRHPSHDWRKPQPGMLAHAGSLFHIDMERSVMVGDQVTDLQAGVASGVGSVVHVLTGHGRKARPAAEAWAYLCKRHVRFVWADDLSEDHDLIVQ